MDLGILLMFFKKKEATKMKKTFVICLLVLLSLSLFVVAHGEEDFAQAEELIESKISCSELSNEQLEIIGDYYMEQMHPGEAHEVMDKMMGGEGSDTLKQAHINMARNFYCGEHDVMSAGMMNMMMGTGLKSKGGMMRMAGSYGMMGYGGYFGFYHVLSAILLIGLIVLVYLWIWKLWKGMKSKKR
jgi:hypothetical protein